MTQRFTLHPAVLATLEPSRERSLARRLRHTLVAVLRDDRGAATAEYAIAMMAAVGFAGLLVVIMRGDEVRELLTGLVRQALSSAG